MTLEGFEGWGDENHYVAGLDPKNVMLNREIAFCDFLEGAPDDVYWFTEPDYRIWRMWPPLAADCELLYREGDGVPLNPSWRLARRKALPLFEECRDEAKKWPNKYDWHCDSEVFAALWKRMREPKAGEKRTYLGVEIGFRVFREYVKPNPIYGRNYAWKAKEELLRAEGR